METVAPSLNSPVYLVIRYHNAPEEFVTLAEAEEFAQNCGDFWDLIMPIRPAQDEIDHYDDFDHLHWVE